MHNFENCITFILTTFLSTNLHLFIYFIVKTIFKVMQNWYCTFSVKIIPRYFICILMLLLSIKSVCVCVYFPIFMSFKNFITVQLGLECYAEQSFDSCHPYLVPHFKGNISTFHCHVLYYVCYYFLNCFEVQFTYHKNR